MNAEKSPEVLKRDNDINEVGNQIQMRLMEASSDPNKSEDDNWGDWIVENAYLFRRAFDALIIEYPPLLDEWNPDELLRKKDTPERQRILKLVLDTMERIRAKESSESPRQPA